MPICNGTSGDHKMKFDQLRRRGMKKWLIGFLVVIVVIGCVGFISSS